MNGDEVDGAVGWFRRWRDRRNTTPPWPYSSLMSDSEKRQWARGWRLGRWACLSCWHALPTPVYLPGGWTEPIRREPCPHCGHPFGACATCGGSGLVLGKHLDLGPQPCPTRRRRALP